MGSLDFRRAPSLVSAPFEDDATTVVRHIWLHFSRLQSAEWHAHVTFIPRSALAAPRPRGIMELTRSWKHIGLTASHCASHVKRTYDVLLHAGSSTASATITYYLNRLNSREQVPLLRHERYFRIRECLFQTFQKLSTLWMSIVRNTFHNPFWNFYPLYTKKLKDYLFCPSKIGNSQIKIQPFETTFMCDF